MQSFLFDFLADFSSPDKQLSSIEPEWTEIRFRYREKSRGVVA